MSALRLGWAAILWLGASLFTAPVPPGTTTLRIEAPFEDLFAAAETDPDAEVDGTLVDGTRDRGGPPVRVTIGVRGHTSRRESECTFPKLKLKLPEGKTLKIGTHCGEGPGDGLSPKYGRLQDQRSPAREVAVYALLEALDIPTLNARRARITYVDARRTIERDAMLLEDDEEAIERLGGKGDIEPSKFTSADTSFEAPDAANLAFAQALIGNFDWCLLFSARDTYRCDQRKKLWNVLAVEMPGGKARPLMYDFDLAGMVTGAHLWFADVFNERFVPSRSAREIEVIAQVQRARSLFARAELDSARRRFAARKQAAYRIVNQAAIDPDGRRYMREYLDAFYREIGSDDRFYRPVVVAEGVVPRAGADASAAAICADQGPIPVGTPVSDPLETRGGWMKVIVLDALWHWAPPAACPPIQKDAIWIERQAVGAGFPKP